jgi:hypothetical protein
LAKRAVEVEASGEGGDDEAWNPGGENEPTVEDVQHWDWLEVDLDRLIDEARPIACHSGPNLNKQLGDEEGDLVEENFVNVGIAEHPLQDLARSALGDSGHTDRGRTT